eukprot:25314-Pelagococcus_subviridis.AAC.1
MERPSERDALSRAGAPSKMGRLPDLRGDGENVRARERRQRRGRSRRLSRVHDARGAEHVRDARGGASRRRGGAKKRRGRGGGGGGGETASHTTPFA